MKLFIVPKIIFKGHSKVIGMLIRAPGFSIKDHKSMLIYFQTKTADITLNIDQGH